MISDEKDIPSSEVDTDYFVRRERVDEANNSIKRVSKLKTQPSQEEVSTSLGRVTSRKSLMDQISEALKRKAAINNRLKLSLATRSDVSLLLAWYKFLLKILVRLDSIVILLRLA